MILTRYRAEFNPIANGQGSGVVPSSCGKCDVDVRVVIVRAMFDAKRHCAVVARPLEGRTMVFCALAASMNLDSVQLIFKPTVTAFSTGRFQVRVEVDLACAGRHRTAVHGLKRAHVISPDRQEVAWAGVLWLAFFAVIDRHSAYPPHHLQPRSGVAAAEGDLPDTVVLKRRDLALPNVEVD